MKKRELEAQIQRLEEGKAALTQALDRQSAALSHFLAEPLQMKGLRWGQELIWYKMPPEQAEWIEQHMDEPVSFVVPFHGTLQLFVDFHISEFTLDYAMSDNLRVRMAGYYEQGCR